MKKLYYVHPEPTFITVNGKEYQFYNLYENIRIYIDKDDFSYFKDLFNSQEKKSYKFRRGEETKVLENCFISEIEYNMDEQIIIFIEYRTF